MKKTIEIRFKPLIFLALAVFATSSGALCSEKILKKFVGQKCPEVSPPKHKQGVTCQKSEKNGCTVWNCSVLPPSKCPAPPKLGPGDKLHCVQNKDGRESCPHCSVIHPTCPEVIPPVGQTCEKGPLGQNGCPLLICKKLPLNCPTLTAPPEGKVCEQTNKNKPDECPSYSCFDKKK